MDSLIRKLEAAVVELAGTGALKDRLSAAFCQHLEDLDLGDSDLPSELQREFADLSATMHQARVLPGDSVVRASVRKLSNDQAERCAALIVRMYGLSAGGRTSARSSTKPRIVTPLVKLLGRETVAASAE
jgi:hypothetical protein